MRVSRWLGGDRWRLPPLANRKRVQENDQQHEPHQAQHILVIH